jgi:hypothetical protein
MGIEEASCEVTLVYGAIIETSRGVEKVSSNIPQQKMPKKRRHTDISSSDHGTLVASLQTTGDDSIESCLAELAGASGILVTPVVCAQSHQHDGHSGAKVDKELYDPTLTAPRPLSLELRDQIMGWNRSMRTFQKTGRYTAGLLPSFDVELTRHFKVQALSTFLLDACKDLKMPAFERWYVGTVFSQVLL